MPCISLFPSTSLTQKLLLTEMYLHMWAVHKACIFNWLWIWYWTKSRQQVQTQFFLYTNTVWVFLWILVFFGLVMLLKLMMSLSPKSSSDVALWSFNLLYPCLSSAAFSMLPWPKPAVWPSVPPDASSEVFLKEKVRVISCYYWMQAY